MGKWKFYTRSLFTAEDCSGVPSATLYTDSPEWLSAFPIALDNYELTIEYNSDLTFTQLQTLIPPDGNFIYYDDYGSITDTGSEKCIEWDVGSSGSCSNNCSDYIIVEGIEDRDTLHTYNVCAPPFAPCEIWTSIKQ